VSNKPERQRPGGTSPLARRPLAPAVEQLHIGGKAAEPVTPEPANPRTPETQNQRTSEPANPETPESVDPGVSEPRAEPRYTQYVRKEARVRDDQAAALVVLRKKVAAQRTAKVEPITDNVLIRLAIDLLLANSDRLTGDTEDQLRAALLASRDSPNH